jgi:hypothetical protein
MTIIIWYTGTLFLSRRGYACTGANILYATRIFVPNDPFNFDLAEHGSSVPGTKVQLWSKTTGQNQTWNIEQLA